MTSKQRHPLPHDLTPDQIWSATKQNMEWSLVTGVDVKGRGKMIEGLSKADVNFMGEVQIGFDEGQVSGLVQAEFDWCKKQDQLRLYNMARELIGLSPIGSKAGRSRQ